MSLLEVSTKKPIMVFYYKTTKGFVSRTVWENHLRFNFETFITFSVIEKKLSLLKHDCKKGKFGLASTLFNFP